MKKLLMTLIVLTLFIFGSSASALAASPVQGNSCTGNTDYWNVLDVNGQSGCLTGTDAGSLSDTLKSYLNSCGGSYGTQDSTAANDSQDAAAADDTQDCTTITTDFSSVAEMLRSYGIYIPDTCTGSTQNDEQSDGQTDDAAPATDDGDAQTSAPADDDTSAPADDDTSAPADDTAAPSDNTANASYAQQVTDLVNEQRAANGLAPLTLSTELSEVAQAKSQDMHDNNYFDHNSPTYGSPFDMMTAFGISYRTAGENIAMGYATPEAVVNAWMNSAGHRANILNSAYTQIGVGYVADGNYWTQEFIG